MRLATKIVSLALLSLPISSMASVPQCSSAALFVASLAETYPNDKSKRTDGFEKIVQSSLNQTNPKVPTREQFNTAYIVMENLVKAWTGGPVQLKEQVIADAAAICMVVSTTK